MTKTRAHTHTQSQYKHSKYDKLWHWEQFWLQFHADRCLANVHASVCHLANKKYGCNAPETAECVRGEGRLKQANQESQRMHKKTIR